MTAKLTAIILAIMLLTAGCTSIHNATEPTVTPTPIETPEPTPAVLDGDALCAQLYTLWEQADAPIIADHLPENMFAAEERWQIFGTTDEDRAWLPVMAEDVAAQLKLTLDSAVDQLAAHPMAPTFTFAAQMDAPSWQLVFSLLLSSSSPEQAAEYIKAAMSLTSQAQQQPDGSYEVTATLSPLPYKEALALPDNDPQRIMSRSFSYSYALTVFDENAREYDEYIQPPAEGNLASGIVWPLGEHTRLRKTWYADRAGGIRKHTGTDIWAPADAELYSCTDGIVTHIGYSDGTGYAVVVTDEYGYEFHYYHMIRQTDFLHAGDSVKAGDLIGHVGNTGNSDLDHLHLSIVAPDGLYVNPYPYLETVEP